MSNAASNPDRDPKNQAPVVLAMTGASGAIYGVRLLQILARAGYEVHVTISPSGAAVIKQELGATVDTYNVDVAGLLTLSPSWSGTTLPAPDASVLSRIHYHRYDDYFTPIASGSFRTQAMVVCPCSGSTLSGIARAAGSNLIQRAAEVHLKEHRKLVLVPRETPLSVLQLENMHRLAAAGAVILPAMPGWYHGVESLDSLVDFIVSRIMDQIGVDNSLIQRWRES
ncbi:3-octaprenyl-4-hydroxybenzoate carboxy-lyase [Rhodopirellula maiorica SM1]|uniref:Flavin prenyltransferase UbiX n=2 Tax=Novipirellula TaxID=2795426 RepID=M5RPK0_9BACT|nr:3-octaprenyl-4-hydroxybenzoate carboxy-lyase [Rhodopirellula maiorica SM1]